MVKLIYDFLQKPTRIVFYILKMKDCDIDWLRLTSIVWNMITPFKILHKFRINLLIVMMQLGKIWVTQMKSCGKTDCWNEEKRPVGTTKKRNKLISKNVVQIALLGNPLTIIIIIITKITGHTSSADLNTVQVNMDKVSIYFLWFRLLIVKYLK